MSAHPAKRRIERANEVNGLCIWCSHPKSDPESPHHRLCCRDQYPPYCSVCYVDVTAAAKARVDEDDMAADRMHGDA